MLVVAVTLLALLGCVLSPPAAALPVLTSLPPVATDKPVIGVLLQPAEGALQTKGFQLLQANMVKFLESSGARVVPIPFDAPESQVEAIFSKVNGIAFMGGPTDIIVTPNHPYYLAAQRLFNLTLAANDADDYFPMMGICLGHQLLLLLAGNDQHLMDGIEFDSEELSIPLNFTSSARESQLVGSMPDAVYSDLRLQPITDNQHHNGVTPDAFRQNAKLPSFFHILSTNLDRRGQEFVSTVEGIHYPIWGVQWHPERPAFEWADQVDRSISAITAGQYVSTFFVDKATRNKHRFASPTEELASLIANYPVTNTNALTNGSYEQIYFFPPSSGA